MLSSNSSSKLKTIIYFYFAVE